MANQNTRDVSLRILIDTLGEENVDKLRQALDALGQQGELSAEEAKGLSDQLDRLTAQSAAIQTLQKLSSEVTELGQRETVAAAAVDQANQALAQQKQVVDTARAAQAQASRTLLEAKNEQTDLKKALQLLNTEYDAAGKKTEEYRNKQRDLITAQSQQAKVIEEARLALRTANAEVTQAVAAQTKLETAQGRAAKAAQDAANAAERQQSAFNSAQAAAQKLGVTTDNLAGASARLADDLDEIRLAAIQSARTTELLQAAQQQLAVELEDVAAAERRAADARAQADLDRAAAETRALAQASALLAAEQDLAAQAARRMADAQAEAAAEAERLRQAQRDEFAKQLAVAQGLLTTELELQADAARRAAAADDQLAAAQDRAAEAARENAAAAQRAGQQINDAFATVGVRSVESLKAEILGVRGAMDVLRDSGQLTGQQLAVAFQRGEAQIQKLEREIRELNGALTAGDKAASLFANSMGQIAAGNLIADGVGYLVNKVKELGREFINANVQAETMRRGLTALYGSAEVAGSQIQFLNDAAKAAGVSVGSISDSFVRFSAATKSSNIPLEVTNGLFQAITRAGGTLGLSAERVALALDALGQMASKGTVSMEELRQQLGDSLPGALSRAAQGLGITEAQLVKLVESGGLAAQDLFPALTKSLQDLQGTNDTLAGSWGRFTTALTQAAVAGGDAGWLDVLKGGMTALNASVGAVAVVLSAITNIIFGLTRAGAAFAGTLMGGGGLVEAMKAFAGESAKAADNVSKTADAFFGAGKAAQAQTTALQQNTAATSGNTSATLALAVAQEKVAGAVQASGNAFVQHMVKVAEDAKAAEVAVSATEKLAKAKADEGKATVAAAQLSGDAARALEAQASAAAANVQASLAVVAAREREVQVTQQAINVVNLERDAQGNLTAGRQQTLETLTKTLATQSAAAEQSRQATAELQAQAAAAKVTAEAYADNATKVEAYRQAMEATAATVGALQRLQAAQKADLDALNASLQAGLITQEQYNAQKGVLAVTEGKLTQATREAAAAQALYRDAVNDSIAAIDRQSRAKSAALSVDLAAVNASKAQYEQLAREAEAYGNTSLAISYRIDAKRKEIEAVKLSTQIKQLELEADKRAVEIQIASLNPQDQLYQKKKEELEIRLQLIKAKQIEAGASATVIRALEQEISALIRGTQVRSGSTGGIDRDTGSRYKNVDAINAQTEALERQKLTSDGLPTNADGSASGTFTNTLPVDKAFDVMQNGIEGKTLEYIREAFKQAQNAQQFISNMPTGSVSTTAVAQTDGLLTNLRQALERAEAREAASKTQQSASSTSTSGGRPTSHTVTINIGGRSQTINTASASDATALVNMIQQLETAAGTSA